MTELKGTWGGKRVGAGRKKGPVRFTTASGETTTVRPKPDPDRLPKRTDPLLFLMDVYNDPSTPIGQRIRAAVSAAQYVHVKARDGGLRDSKAVAARHIGNSSKLSPGKRPSVVVPLVRPKTDEE